MHAVVVWVTCEGRSLQHQGLQRQHACSNKQTVTRIARSSAPQPPNSWGVEAVELITGGKV